jgi:2-oxoglutarate dehydrogenase E2 component (dihydrolipoamide succinyltransferase)
MEATGCGRLFNRGVKMSTNVVMPQMGESIAEGTVVRWIKKVGDAVDRDEPLFEISTDKVDAEIPSPGAGVLTEIKVKEGETVPVNSVVAVIGEAGARAEAQPAAATESATAPPSAMPEAAAGQPESAPAVAATAEGRAGLQPRTPARSSAPAAPPGSALTKEELRRQKSSPLVRRIAREHNVDIRQINGTGISGRVTKNDILGFLESGKEGRPFDRAQGKRAAGPAYGPGDRVEIVPMTIMRRKIAEHMVLSAHTSPHVYSVYEVNFGRLSQLRERKKAEYERAGGKL